MDDGVLMGSRPGKVRVLIADDSALVRGLLRSFLEGEDDFEIVGEAENGREAVEMVRACRPDVLTLDLEMPVMGGLEAIEEIMSTCAVPILVVSSEADARNAYAAVARGALEAVNKPSLDVAEQAEFVAKVRLVAKVRVITHVRALRVTAARAAAAAGAGGDAGAGEPAGVGNAGALVSLRTPPDEPASDRGADSSASEVIQAIAQSIPGVMAALPSRRVAATGGAVFAIASSTGGPQALARILGQLPRGFSAPILIAQHIADGFAAGMADWLATVSALPVQIGRDGDPVVAGVVHIAPSEAHLSVTPARRLALIERRPGDIYRPSCDVLLNSVAAVYGARAVGLILTGMSRDGVAGMQAIRAAGGHTIAQDEASSVIYGMNRVAIECGCIREVLPLDDMPAAMVRCVTAAAGVRQGCSVP